MRKVLSILSVLGSRGQRECRIVLAIGRIGQNTLSLEQEVYLRKWVLSWWILWVLRERILKSENMQRDSSLGCLQDSFRGSYALNILWVLSCKACR